MRLSVLVLCLMMAAPVAAQEPPSGASPEAPVTAFEAPQPPAMAERLAPPALPGAEAPKTEAAPHETDLASIVLKAHWVVQAVMAALAFMAFLVLTVLLYKAVEIARVQRHLGRSLAVMTAARQLGQLGPRLPAAPEAGAAMVRLVEAELADLPAVLTQPEAAGLRERCQIGLARVEAVALHRLRTGVGLLAQIAATAPFIGLFGTVFGIMNAFLAIAATRTTSLTVVAPGIAEALLATAVGLGAAIPAVLVYNLLNRRIAVFRHRLGDVTAMTERLLSREIAQRLSIAEAR